MSQLDPLVWSLTFLQEFDVDLGAAYLQLVHDALNAEAQQYASALQVRFALRCPTIFVATQSYFATFHSTNIWSRE